MGRPLDARRQLGHHHRGGPRRAAVWAFVEPDRWTLELRRTWHKFHVPPPGDSTDVQLRLDVRPESGPMTDILTFDFPVVQPTATTLRFRWGTVVVPLEIAVQ